MGEGTKRLLETFESLWLISAEYQNGATTIASSATERRELVVVGTV
jgi:hypothetical protein